MATVVVIKQAYFIGYQQNQVFPLPGAEVRLTDKPWSEDEPESSIKLPSDFLVRKPSTDVVVAASAMARDQAPSKQLDVLVRVGPVERILRVFGLRLWYRAAVGMGLTSPEPFEKVDLKWELAWGGSDHGDDKWFAHDRNPVGRGYVRDSSSLLHKPGPQIEDPREPIRSHRTNPTPAGVGAIGRRWAPRISYGGTYDEAWQRTRMPLPPVDFDERFNQCATPELITPEYLRGGEQVDLHNVAAEGPIRFNLPRQDFFVGAETQWGMVPYPVVLDTVVFNLVDGERLVEMVWRAVVRMPHPPRDLRAIEVRDKAAP
ncbi:MAG: DUF2169 domain-containing protein [Deltaproteobacteria bacterium]|nr:DUF2169 domain-containing protein [Deltaproteobacteria bacterium]